MSFLEKRLNDDIAALIAPFEDKIGIAVIGDGFKFFHREKAAMLSASLIKLPILLYAFAKAAKDPGILEKRIRPGREDIVGGSGVLQVLEETEWTIRDLLALMIAVSDNTATNLLMDEFGIDAMQNWGRGQGLSATVISRKMMDEQSKAEGRENMISAGDACRCMERIFGAGIRAEDSADAQSWLARQQFRDKLPGLVDEVEGEEVVVFNKTGEMEGIEHDAGYFSYRERGVFAAVLTSGIEPRTKAVAVIQQIGRKIADDLIECGEGEGRKKQRGSE